MSYIDDAERAIRGFEGCIPHMYLDTRGYVTVGIGLLVPDLAFAQALPFQLLNGVHATRDQIAADFHRVSTMPKAMVASAYRAATSPVISSATIDEKLREYLVVEDDKLSSLYGPAYHSSPDPAKVGLLDIGYNCGTENLVRKWPILHGDVETHNWAGAVTACVRPEAPPVRNLWTQNQFRAAQRMAGA